MDRGAWQTMSMVSQRVWHDWVTNIFIFLNMARNRKKFLNKALSWLLWVQGHHWFKKKKKRKEIDYGNKARETLFMERVQFSSVAQSCPTLCDPMDCSMPGLPVHHRLLELAQTHVHWVSDTIHLILCCPLLFLPSIFPRIRIFSNESDLPIRWPKYWSFGFSISPSNEHSGLISFRMDWLNLLAVQGTLKSLLQHHSSNASILWCSAFFIVQISHPHMTTGKTIALTRQTSVSKVMSLLLNILSSLITAFLPGSKHLLISWLQSQSEVIMEPKKIKPLTVSTVSPSICHEMVDQMPWS